MLELFYLRTLLRDVFDPIQIQSYKRHAQEVIAENPNFDSKAPMKSMREKKKRKMIRLSCHELEARRSAASDILKQLGRATRVLPPPTKHRPAVGAN